MRIIQRCILGAICVIGMVGAGSLIPATIAEPSPLIVLTMILAILFYASIVIGSVAFYSALSLATELLAALAEEP